jgi:hypothetical protein
MGRQFPSLSFLHVLLGDEAVLTPESRLYQRLLAMDYEEAKQVLESTMKDKSLEELYDSMLIPALGLAEQDRHRNKLDDATEGFICQTTKELIEDLDDKYDSESNDSNGEYQIALSQETAVEGEVPTPDLQIICVPAVDEADEIVGLMLAQVLERAGHRAYCVPLSRPAEMLAQVAQEKPDIVCVSALPPFAIAHSRTLYAKLRAQLPNVEIVVGLWNFNGDITKAARRIGMVGARPFTRLAQVVNVIGVSRPRQRSVPGPGEKD